MGEMSLSFVVLSILKGQCDILTKRLYIITYQNSLAQSVMGGQFLGKNSFSLSIFPPLVAPSLFGFEYCVVNKVTGGEYEYMMRKILSPLQKVLSKYAFKLIICSFSFNRSFEGNIEYSNLAKFKRNLQFPILSFYFVLGTKALNALRKL